MSLPRVLSLSSEGTLLMKPPEEIELLRYNAKKWTDLQVDAGSELPVPNIEGNALELDLEFNASGANQYGLKVCCSPDGKEGTLVYYDAADKKLKVDTTKSSLSEGPKTIEAGPFELKAAERLKLRVFVDKSVVEVFANGRQAVMRRIYPSRPDSTRVKLFSNGAPASISNLEAWQMAPSNPF